MSKDVKPKIRIGQKSSRMKKAVLWTLVLVVGGGAGYGAYQKLAPKQTVDIPVARVRKGEFVISVRARGDLKSVNSVIITAPQVPDPRIVKLAESGRAIRKGDVIVEFDAANQEQMVLNFRTNAATVESEIVNLKASQKMTDEADQMNLMTAGYNVQRSELEASKAEVVSAIEGAKSRIDVGISKGELGQVHTTIKAHDISQAADLQRLQQKKDKTDRDMQRAKGYLSKMVLELRWTVS
jgi:multidrug efflux pump subunit AcrA (membrane-fusion protein)